MVQAQEDDTQINRTEWKTETRYKPITLCSINLQQSRKEYAMPKRQSLQQMVLGKLDSNMQKHETGPLSSIIHKNKFQMD